LASKSGEMSAQHGPADDTLVARIATGDRASMSALFRRRQGEVFRFALHLTGSRAIAEDVTQEVFLAVIHDAGRYDPKRSSVTAWLCGIARNHARRRFDRDRAMVPLDEGGDKEAPSDRSDALGDLAKAEDIETVRKAVLSLPLPYREAVVLCDLEELSYADAAAALECAVGTVRSRLHRGRGLLAAKLAGIARSRWIA
jgi:RNA polymerase sigma-70 factor (ECF subfamily)